MTNESNLETLMERAKQGLNVIKGYSELYDHRIAVVNEAYNQTLKRMEISESDLKHKDKKIGVFMYEFFKTLGYDKNDAPHLAFNDQKIKYGFNKIDLLQYAQSTHDLSYGSFMGFVKNVH